MGAAGVLLGTAARDSTIATSASFGWNVLESLPIPAGIRPYTPFGLVSSLMGGAGDVSAPAATAVLLAYLAAFALIVRRYALRATSPE